MSTKTVHTKLRIKPGYKILILGQPDGYDESLGELPEDVMVEN